MFEGEIPVVILTKDRDALQLVSERIRVWLNTSKWKDLVRQDELLWDGNDLSLYNAPDGFFEVTPLTFGRLYDGLTPPQVVDLKALEGDSSDNIPGVKGVGEKAVLPLLCEYGTVENLYEQIEGLTKTEQYELKVFFKSLGVSRSPLAYLLKESDTELVGKRAALLSKELATIKTDIEALQHTSLDDLRLDLNWNEATEVFKRLEFEV